MKNNLSITYIKNGDEKLLTNSIIYRLSIKDLIYLSIEGNSKFSLIYSKELFRSYLTLKDDIEYICIKNAIFDERLELKCENPDSIFILEDCTFKCNWIDIQNGNYQIINPNFDLDYKNEINILNCQSFEITGNKKNTLSSMEIENTDNIIISSIDELKKLKIKQNLKTTINEVNNINEFNIITELIEIKNCPNTFNILLNRAQCLNYLLTKNIILNNTNILCNINNFCLTSIKLENSSLNYFSDIEKRDTYFFPNLTELILENSNIIFLTNIDLPKIKKIKLDNFSYLKVKNSIQIGKYKYYNQLDINNNFILNKDTLNDSLFMRRLFLIYLKEIIFMYDSKIKDNLFNEEQSIINELKKEKEREIMLIEENTNKKIITAKQRIKSKQLELLSKTTIGNIN